jgi:hypothetical protein
MRKKNVVISFYILFIIVMISHLSAEEKKKIITSVHFTVGYTAANNNSSDFFDVYQDELNGIKKKFTFPALAGLSVKVKYPERIRFGLDAHYQYIDMRDYYEEVVNFGYTKGTRQIAQEFAFTTRAVFAVIEYIPIIAQFRTYTGAGIGANFGSLFWNETISSDIRNDKRIGGNHLNMMTIDPAFKLYTGLELGFDKEEPDDYLGSIFFELMFIKIFRYERILADVYPQMDDPSDKLKEKYGIATSYISFNIGVSFNVDIFKLNVEKRKK